MGTTFELKRNGAVRQARIPQIFQSELRSRLDAVPDVEER